MTAVAIDTVTIRLELGCSEECDAFAAPLLDQLAGGDYRHCSVLHVPETVHEWTAEHRTARKRSARARRLGYVGSIIRRHEHADAIHSINTSLPERQGRPMSAGYQARPSDIPEQTPSCDRHGVHPYGVLLEGTLVAYTWIYRAGELALVSQILGHGGHLANDVMYELAHTAICAEVRHGGVLVYNRHDSGTEGLRYYKERVGFVGRDVEWRA